MAVQDPTSPTGVTGPNNGGTHRAAMRKARAALQMRSDQVGWLEITETLGYPTPQAAIVAVERALEQGLNTDESKQFMRMLAGQKLEELIYSLYTKATDAEHPEQIPAAREVRQLIAEHARIKGYVAPTEVSIYNPMDREIEEFVGALARSKTPEIETGDIFEMEEDSDGVFVAPEPRVSVDDF